MIEYTSLEGMKEWARSIMKRDPDFVIGDSYLRRWWVIPRNEYCNVYLHEINKSDDDRAGHDHPWMNTSYLIDGEYEEVVYYDNKPWMEMNRYRRKAGDVVSRQATDTHRLIVPDGAKAISLFITGPKVRDWGFWCANGPKFVPWQEFVDTCDKGQVGQGCGE